LKFNYSYRAFLITSLLLGILVLTLFSIKLNNETEPQLEKYDVEYAEVEKIPEEKFETPKTSTAQNTKIETNRAYNESKKYLSKNSDQNLDATETTEGKLAQMEAAIENVETTKGDLGISATSGKSGKSKKTSNSNTKDETTSINASANRRTTISYSLVKRTATELPNPVYTCESGGKVVINIVVDNNGQVIKTDYNSGASTTKNGCLIDMAEEYAKSSTFTTSNEREKQLGTITYNFPGQ